MVQPIEASRPAAQYVRMSSERQDCSLEYQRAVIAAYALQQGYEVVRTYEDAGLSGLTIGKREGLRNLIADVVAGTAPFSVRAGRSCAQNFLLPCALSSESSPSCTTCLKGGSNKPSRLCSGREPIRCRGRRPHDLEGQSGAGARNRSRTRLDTKGEQAIVAFLAQAATRLPRSIQGRILP